MIRDILPLLDQVKTVKPNQWKACCPAHADKTPSLSLKELDDGKVLIKCWSGCNVEDITYALGLELQCLFPPKPEPLNSQYSQTKADKPQVTPSQLEKLNSAVRFELLILRMCSARIRDHFPISLESMKRTYEALIRLDQLRSQGIEFNHPNYFHATGLAL